VRRLTLALLEPSDVALPADTLRHEKVGQRIHVLKVVLRDARARRLVDDAVVGEAVVRVGGEPLERGQLGAADA
jgi:hypothetical protein